MNWKHSPLKFPCALTANVDVSKIAVYFGGGGHMRAAGCDLQGSVYDVINNVTEQICKQFQEHGSLMDGVIVIRKEKGFTSHDVVAKLRGILHMKKIGHTGTLDPDAEGVLPVALGKATRLVDMITDKEKTYEAVMRLGVVTDTQDMSGTVLSQTTELSVTEEELCTVVSSFVGDYMQVPPMYSALKVNGKKLYELAQRGQDCGA